MTDGHYKCTAAEPGGGGRCGCVEKQEVIHRYYECDINWELELMAQCALEGGICLLLCYLNPEPVSCIDCLGGVTLDCCGGDECTPCDFIACEDDVSTRVDDELSVFDYFEGDSCGG